MIALFVNKHFCALHCSSLSALIFKNWSDWRVWPVDNGSILRRKNVAISSSSSRWEERRGIFAAQYYMYVIPWLCRLMSTSSTQGRNGAWHYRGALRRRRAAAPQPPAMARDIGNKWAKDSVSLFSTLLQRLPPSNKGKCRILCISWVWITITLQTTTRNWKKTSSFFGQEFIHTRANAKWQNRQYTVRW